MEVVGIEGHENKAQGIASCKERREIKKEKEKKKHLAFLSISISMKWRKV